MKNILFFLLAISLFTSSCNTDDDTSPDATTLSYDAENFSAPVLPEDKYEAAARFTSSETSALNGKFLRAVEFYLVNVAATTEVIIYAAGDTNQPGDALYSANVSSAVTTDSWNTHTLSTPIEITGDDLWIAIKVDHPEEFGSVGCDPGPANANGDFLFVNSDNSWTNLRSFTNQATDINWNIRGIVED